MVLCPLFTYKPFHSVTPDITVVNIFLSRKLKRIEIVPINRIDCLCYAVKDSQNKNNLYLTVPTVGNDTQ